MTALATVSLDLLEREIETRYRCKAVPIEKQIVKAMVGDRLFTVLVTTFELLARGSADYCYAWVSPSTDGTGKITVIRKLASVQTAEDAVWARLDYEDGR